MEQPVVRVRRRAVGPPGAQPEQPGGQGERPYGQPGRPGAGPERTVDHTDPADRPRSPEDEDERFRADRPPHHDR